MQIKRCFLLNLAILLLLASQHSQAAGFALIEQSASGTGNAYAGGAAAAEDASTIFFNPAGMTYLPDSQGIIALDAIRPVVEFNNNGSVAGAGKPLGSDGGDAGSWGFVPNLYWSKQLEPNLYFGLGINAPFGLKSDYDKDWIGRFQALKSDVKSLNINPSLAYKVNDWLSIGAGLSAMYIHAGLSRAVNFGLAGEGSANIRGSDWGFGYNLGAIWQLTPDSRIGLAYRSRVRQTLENSVKFDRPALVPAAAAPNGNISANLDLPETLSLSGFSHISERWDLMADATWTGWSRFEQLKIVRNNGALLALTPENWHNTMRYSIGASYRYNADWKLRAGIAYDQEAIPAQFRTARIPADDRKWLALGANYRLNESTSMDIGYAHLFVSDPSINDNQLASGNGLLKGSYNIKLDILSVQFTHNF